MYTRFHYTNRNKGYWLWVKKKNKYQNMARKRRIGIKNRIDHDLLERAKAIEIKRLQLKGFNQGGNMGIRSDMRRMGPVYRKASKPVWTPGYMDTGMYPSVMPSHSGQATSFVDINNLPPDTLAPA